MDSWNDPIDYYTEEEENEDGEEETSYYFVDSSIFDELNDIVISDIKRTRYTDHIKDIADWIDTQRDVYEWYDDDWKPGP